MDAISAIAGIGFVVPLFVILQLMLLVRHDHEVALSWGLGTLAAVAIATVARRVADANFDLPHFPSGHVALAVAFYGGLIEIFLGGGRRLGGLGRMVAVLGAVAAVEGYSRVLLTDHTWLDVAGGFVAGTAGLVSAGCPWLYRRVRTGSPKWLAAVALAAIPFAIYVSPWIDAALRDVTGL